MYIGQEWTLICVCIIISHSQAYRHSAATRIAAGYRGFVIRHAAILLSKKRLAAAKMMQRYYRKRLKRLAHAAIGLQKVGSFVCFQSLVARPLTGILIFSRSIMKYLDVAWLLDQRTQSDSYHTKQKCNIDSKPGSHAWSKETFEVSMEKKACLGDDSGMVLEKVLVCVEHLIDK